MIEASRTSEATASVILGEAVSVDSRSGAPVANVAHSSVTNWPRALPAAAPALSLRKRALDVFGSLGLLLVFLPLLLLLALMIRLDSPGPALFRQKRTGLNGRPFVVLKLRTMRVTEDDDAVSHATRSDDRTTELGLLLRKTSLDELPQLINVLRGEMSLVGPRPHALTHDRHYASLVLGYERRFRVRPGLTGLAQVSGQRGGINEIGCMQRRVASDNAYIDNWSFASDMQILLRTVPLMVRDPNAY